jgi:hypothetical protein
MNANQICENIDCPICMDTIVSFTNRVTTECGHCFHASCLMTSVAHNGFGCPYCRTVMAETPADEEEDEWEDEEENEEEEYVLRGFRLFYENLENLEHDPNDIAEEEQEEVVEEAEEEPIALPSVAFISAKLARQGVTMEDLVKVLLNDHEEYENGPLEEEIIRMSDALFGKMRAIISNFKPDDEPRETNVAVMEQAPANVTERRARRRAQ